MFETMNKSLQWISFFNQKLDLFTSVLHTLIALKMYKDYSENNMFGLQTYHDTNITLSQFSYLFCNDFRLFSNKFIII